MRADPPHAHVAATEPFDRFSPIDLEVHTTRLGLLHVDVDVVDDRDPVDAGLDRARRTIAFDLCTGIDIVLLIAARDDVLHAEQIDVVRELGVVPIDGDVEVLALPRSEHHAGRICLSRFGFHQGVAARNGRYRVARIRTAGRILQKVRDHRYTAGAVVAF